MDTSESDSSNLQAQDYEADELLLAAIDEKQASQGSRLIEFPGVSRSSVPEWRKEVTERVREVHERRVREATSEAREAELVDTKEAKKRAKKPVPSLELLPQAEVPPMNPLVAAALRRIERAHADSTPTMTPASNPSRVAALANAAKQAFPSLGGKSSECAGMLTSEIPASSSDHLETETFADNQTGEGEKTHNLVMVPPSIEPVVTPREENAKRRRIIGEDLNSPALNYLDSIATTLQVEDTTKRASTFRRLLASLIDLALVILLSSPLAAGVEWDNWHYLQMMGLAAPALLLVHFLYSTICTAMTGRTLGMRLLSLRVVDARTGLIPTGKQSAVRALLYVVALLSAGIALAYALIDSEKRPAHDRFTQTTVIRA